MAVPAERHPSQPVFLTVEEAAAFLRIGRTKAYAMTREWRATNGRSGMPVRDLGGLLRVPVDEFERQFGVRLTSGDWQDAEPPPAPTAQPSAQGASKSHRHRRTAGAQLGLFNPEG